MLARQMLRDHGLVALGYFVLLQGALAAAILYWPDFRDNIPAVLDMIPIETLRRQFEPIRRGQFWAYFCLQQYFKGVTLFGLAAAAVIGSGLIAREADQGTAEFLLSRPVTRRRILLVRWSIGGLLLIAPVFLSSLGGMLLASLVGESLRLGPVLAASAHLSLFLLALFGFTVWMSAGFSHQLRAGTLLIGLVLLQFALYLVKVLNRYSLFVPVDVEHLLPIGNGVYPWTWSAIFAAASALLLLLALLRFRRRDF